MTILSMPRFSARNGFLAALLPLVGLLSACRAPGMKMNLRSSSKVETAVVGETNVAMRPISPAIVQGLAVADPASDLTDLLAVKPGPYKIGPQDVLLVTVWDHPEITLPLGQYRTDATTGMVVDDEGFLYFPYIGRTSLGGLTVVQARERLTTRLGSILKNPQVDVKVILFRSKKVYFGGEVRNPSTYPLADDTQTLADLVTRAGGFMPTADQSRVILTRGGRKWTINFMELLKVGSPVGRIALQDGDALHVQSRAEEPVYVMGELVRPGTIPMNHGRLSLAQALSDAGGILNTAADPRSIYVLRRGPRNDWVEAYHLDAYNPVAMVMADRFPLQPRDVVYVDAGPLVRWNRVMTLLVPTVNALTSTASELKYLSTSTK